MRDKRGERTRAGEWTRKEETEWGSKPMLVKRGKKEGKWEKGKERLGT